MKKIMFCLLAIISFSCTKSEIQPSYLGTFQIEVYSIEDRVTYNTFIYNSKKKPNDYLGTINVTENNIDILIEDSKTLVKDNKPLLAKLPLSSISFKQLPNGSFNIFSDSKIVGNYSDSSGLVMDFNSPVGVLHYSAIGKK